MLFRRMTLAFSEFRHTLFTVYEMSRKIRGFIQKVCASPFRYNNRTQFYFLYDSERGVAADSRRYFEFLERRRHAGHVDPDHDVLFRCVYANEK